MKDIMKRILCTTQLDHLTDVEAFLKAHAELTVKVQPTDDELLELVGPCHALITNISQKITGQIMDAAQELQVISTPSTGTDHIDLDAARQRGIAVQSLKNDYEVLSQIPSTAEHAFLLMLSCMRHLTASVAHVKEGGWDRDHFRGYQAHGKTVGIVGYGRLGEMFSRLAKGFGMHVVACDPNREIEDPWVTQLDFDALLEASDVVTVHVHLSPETKHMFDEDAFSKMKEDSYFINTSRGGLVNESALLNALETKKIRAAGLDVLENELSGDLSGDPLIAYARENTNLIITPHVGGCNDDAQRIVFMHTAQKLIHALS